MKFTTGLIAGSAVGMAVSVFVLQKMRPDVANKMVHDGKRALKHYRKMFD